MEVLSEHNCHGWLEGNTLTGRHGMFATYEAFAIDAAGSPPGSTDTLVPAATGSAPSRPSPSEGAAAE